MMMPPLPLVDANGGSSSAKAPTSLARETILSRTRMMHRRDSARSGSGARAPEAAPANLLATRPPGAAERRRISFSGRSRESGHGASWLTFSTAGLIVLLACLACGSHAATRSVEDKSHSLERLSALPRPSRPSLLVGGDQEFVLQSRATCPAECSMACDGDCPQFPDRAPQPEEPGESAPAFECIESPVEALQTPISGSEAAKALASAYRRYVGRRPSHETLSILAAHWAHETNQGAAMYNYNFGGIKGVGPTGAYAVHRTHEGAGIRTQRKRLRFRAYLDATSGAMDYLSLLQRLYGPALEGAQRGDIVAFVQELKRGGYFSDDEAVYLRKLTAFVALSKKWGFSVLGPSGISPKHKASRLKAGLPT